MTNNDNNHGGNDMGIVITETKEQITPSSTRHTIVFARPIQYGCPVVVGKMCRWTGERDWQVFLHGEDQGRFVRSAAYEWLEMRTERLARQLG